jgi:HlyD family secretion protein
MDTLTLYPRLFPARKSPPPNTRNSLEESPGIRHRRFDGQALALVALSALACAMAGLALTVAVRGRLAHPPVRYRTETVVMGQVTGLLPLAARIVPTTEIRVGTERPGRILSVAVRPGDRVRKGDVLARLDTLELRAAVAGAQAGALAAQVGARQAQLRMAQIIYLLQQNMSGRTAEDEEKPVEVLEAAALDAEANLANAAAELHRQAAARVTTRANLAAAVLRAPIDGVVVSRTVEPNETVQAGATLFVVAADPSRVQVVATVGEVDAGHLRRGASGTFQVPAHPGRTFQTGAGQLEPAPSSSGAPYRLRLEAPNPGLSLHPGMSATVKIASASSATAMSVPVEALSFSPDGPVGEPGSGVYVLGEGARPRRIAVEVGVSDGRMAEIRSSALRPGAEVIVADRR